MWGAGGKATGKGDDGGSTDEHHDAICRAVQSVCGKQDGGMWVQFSLDKATGAILDPGEGDVSPPAGVGTERVLLSHADLVQYERQAVIAAVVALNSSKDVIMQPVSAGGHYVRIAPVTRGHGGSAAASPNSVALADEREQRVMKEWEAIMTDKNCPLEVVLRVCDGASWGDGPDKCKVFGDMKLTAGETLMNVVGRIAVWTKRALPDIVITCIYAKKVFGQTSCPTKGQVLFESPGPGCTQTLTEEEIEEGTYLPQFDLFTEEKFAVMLEAYHAEMLDWEDMGAQECGVGTPSLTMVVYVAAYKLHNLCWDIEHNRATSTWQLKKDAECEFVARDPDDPGVPLDGYSGDPLADGKDMTVSGSVMLVGDRKDDDWKQIVAAAGFDPSGNGYGGAAIRVSKNLMLVHDKGRAPIGENAADVPRKAYRTALTLPSMAEWKAMSDPDQKAQWLRVGLSDEGHNVTGDGGEPLPPLLKEGLPMVGACSYDDKCLSNDGRARWPFRCAVGNCNGWVDRQCCMQYFIEQPGAVQEGLKAAKDIPTLQTTDHRMSLTGELTNFRVCFRCMKRSVATLKRDAAGASSR